MSGFDKNWLELREPADCAARAKPLLERVRQHLNARPQPRLIMDIGCGTGSTYRTLSPLLPTYRWKLVDYAPALLEEAHRRIGSNENIEFRCQDLNRFDETLLDGVTIVTASALFDLCSTDFSELFLERLASRQIGLYAALNYDGVMKWSITHPLDEQVVEDFNRHQRSDKGFGPALGPDATAYLSTLCKTSGFTVITADSAWRLGPSSAELQREFLAGLQRPILEIGNVDEASFKDWLDFRGLKIGMDGSLCIVGHTDFLALPRN
ncbi:class I SAM-dependent methyltransferase [Agrobacterium tumefaciens]|uniref:class I SAM-dependent methyltransferase n=1 Tax=Agrobacterium tumefaciens TaxID=358 RepID=UPI0021D04A81|nr:class I SAM-dependent methyltransferase [Agrobacterium tumefaciens]UXS05290.1 class I SAM-dependent methyltransferase [Agrobacterium tumefaciens]